MQRTPTAAAKDWTIGSALAVGGLCIYTFTIVTTRLPLADVGIAVAVAGLIIQAHASRVPLPLWIYLAYVGWAYLGSFTSAFPDMVVAQVVEQLKLLCVMAIIVNALRTEGQVRLYLVFYLACFMAYPGRGTIINYMSGNTVFGRAIGNSHYANPNELAAQALFALGVAIGIALSDTRRLLRLASFASAVALFVIILLTQSRGGIIGFAVTMAPALLAMGRQRPGRLAAGTIVVAIAVAAYVPATAWQRLAGIGKLASADTIAQADVEGSAAERYEIYKVAVRITSDHPVLGVGLGTYGEMNARYAPELGRKDTHNTYLNLAAELGVPGLLIWCALVATVLRNAYHARKTRPPDEPFVALQSWIERALWAYLVSGLFATYSKINILYVMLALLWSTFSTLKAREPAPATVPTRP